MLPKLRSLLIGRSRYPVSRGACASLPLGLPARRKWAILLALALLFTQYVLIAHQIGHQPDASEASWELCLVAPHQGSTPSSKDSPPAIVHGQDAGAFSAIAGRVTSQITTGFSARAPPFFPHA